MPSCYLACSPRSRVDGQTHRVAATDKDFVLKSYGVLTLSQRFGVLNRRRLSLDNQHLPAHLTATAGLFTAP
jgi:hypothetical protein